jgi:nicotinamide-nucleotide amidase
MIPSALLEAAASLLEACRTNKKRLATAESCTGGLIAATLSAFAGYSDVLECGFFTYSNQAKTGLLGVPCELIRAEGAVSEPMVRRMAEGALQRSHADIAVSVTGVAGPGGGTAEKPADWSGLAWRNAFGQR